MNLIRKGKFDINNSLKILSKKVFKAALNLMFLSYVGFSLISLSACNKADEELTYEQQVEKRSHTIKLLEEKFYAKFFDCSSEQVAGQVVILDTLVLGIRNEDGDFIIKAKINNTCGKKYFAELKCSKGMIEQFKETKSNYSILAARINKILDYNLIAEADSLSGEVQQLNLGSSVLLTGDCLAFAEVPAIINAN